jgi:rod shape-determining protein MreD
VSEETGLILRWTTVLVVGFVLQIGVLVDVAPFGVHADAMLLLAICAGLAGGPARGAVVGFAAGLLADVMLPGTLGISALAYAAVGFGVGAVQEAVLSSTRLMSVVFTTVASALGVLLYALCAQLLGQRSLTDPRLLRIVGIVSLLNALLCVPALAVSRWAEGDRQRVGVR